MFWTSKNAYECVNESEILLPATCQLGEDLWGVITGEDWHHWDINQNIIVYLSPRSTVRYKNMIKAIEKLKSTKTRCINFMTLTPL